MTKACQPLRQCRGPYEACTGGLSKSACHLCRRGWYEGLSEAFLGSKGPKVLMLAGTDRLDRTLTIGQMQGRFQMVVLPQVLHLPPFARLLISVLHVSDLTEARPCYAATASGVLSIPLRFPTQSQHVWEVALPEAPGDDCHGVVRH